MRVLLVQTPSVEGISSERVYPLGIVLLATHLKRAGHEVEIVDMNIGFDPYGDLQEKLMGFRPEVVCLSLRNIDPLANKTSSLVPPFLTVIRFIAAVLPEAWLIVGGTGFSLFPERLLCEAPQIHFGIVGEAEYSLPALLSSLGPYPPPVDGLCRRESGRVLVTPPSSTFDMSRYLPPSRDLWDILPYLEINSYVPAVGIEAKRGCPFNCAYCVYPGLQGKKPRCRPARDVVDEIEVLRKEYGVNSFHFTDPVLNIPGGYLEEICQEILRRKLRVKWDGFFREAHLDEKNVHLFEEAGCECFSFSPDGLCQEALDVLGKGLTEGEVLRAAELVAGTEVISVYHFMVNFPGQTEKTCEKGMRMIERLYEIHAKKRNLGTIVLNNIRILPGTLIEKMAREEGFIDEQTDLLYPVYYNPKPFENFRYRLEALSLCENVFMWKGVKTAK